MRRETSVIQCHLCVSTAAFSTNNVKMQRNHEKKMWKVIGCWREQHAVDGRRPGPTLTPKLTLCVPDTAIEIFILNLYHARNNNNIQILKKIVMCKYPDATEAVVNRSMYFQS